MCGRVGELKSDSHLELSSFGRAVRLPTNELVVSRSGCARERLFLCIEAGAGEGLRGLGKKVRAVSAQCNGKQESMLDARSEG